MESTAIIVICAVALVLYIGINILIDRIRGKKVFGEYDSTNHNLTHDLFIIESDNYSSLKFNVSSDGRFIAHLSIHIFNRWGEIVVLDRQYIIKRIKFLPTAFEVQVESGRVAVVEKYNWHGNTFCLKCDECVFILNYVNYNVAVFQSESLIGKIDREEASLPKSLSLDKKIMIIWLAIYIFKRIDRQNAG
jgi:hypothetical protein